MTRPQGRQKVNYRPRDEDGEVRRLEASHKTPEPVLEDAQRYLDQGRTVMFLTSCSYMLTDLIDSMRRHGVPFHNPHRRNNGAWNPLQRRRNQVSTPDRVLSYLNLSNEGTWSAEDLRRWTACIRTSGVMPPKGRKLLDEIQDGELGGVDWDVLFTLFTQEAIDAGLSGDLEWFQKRLQSNRKGPAEYPINIARNHGADMLRESPRAIIGTIHSSKGAEADVVYLFPDLSIPGMTEWTGDPQSRAGIFRLFYVGMTRAKESLVLCDPVSRHHVPI